MRRILLRADGNSNIGLGHVVRLLALAEMLKDDYELNFIIQAPDDKLLQIIKNVCNKVINIPASDQYIKEAEIIAHDHLKKDDIVVLDGYNFKAEYQRILKNKSIKLVCIDDIHSYHFLADVVINHAGNIPLQKYSVLPHTKLCLGPEYALLRRAFLQAVTKNRNLSEIKKVFIAFGGTDIHNFSKMALNACLKLNLFSEINVVLGMSYSHQEELNEIIGNYGPDTKVVLHRNLNPEEMVEIMSHCHLGICSASTIAYEACCVGMALICGSYEDNQLGISKFLSEAKCASVLGDFQTVLDVELQQMIERITPEKGNEMINNQRRVFSDSSKSINKVFSLLGVEEKLKLRKAKLSDLETYFDWVNENSVRENSVDTKEISLKEHSNWFQAKLRSTSSYLYVLENENKKSIGQIRFDLENGVFAIGFSVNYGERGKGYGELVVKKGIEQICLELEERPSFSALVKKENQHSLKVFQNNSFSVVETKEIDGEDYIVYRK